MSVPEDESVLPERAIVEVIVQAENRDLLDNALRYARDYARVQAESLPDKRRDPGTRKYGWWDVAVGLRRAAESASPDDEAGDDG